VFSGAVSIGCQLLMIFPTYVLLTVVFWYVFDCVLPVHVSDEFSYINWLSLRTGWRPRYGFATLNLIEGPVDFGAQFLGGAFMGALTRKDIEVDATPRRITE
jgi:hypothetical protein